MWQFGVVSSRAGKSALLSRASPSTWRRYPDRLSYCTEIGDEVSIGLLQQEVLPGWPELWLVTTREWFRQVRLRALERMCDQHRAAGTSRLRAAAAGLAAVACDPLRESAHRRLAMIHMSEGNLAEALRQYHVYRELVRSELGLPPSSQFRRLVAPAAWPSSRSLALSPPCRLVTNSLRATREGEVKTAAHLARHVMPLERAWTDTDVQGKEDGCVRAAFRPGG